MRTTVAKEFRFEAAHRLTSPEVGQCAQIHGHGFRVRVEIFGPVYWDTGMVVNFRDLEFIKKYLDSHFDHTLLLNDGDSIVEALEEIERGCPPAIRLCLMPGGVDPTAENLAWMIWNHVDAYMRNPGPDWVRDQVQLSSVTVWETSKCSATVAR